jgi:hypothetical protein
MGFHIPDNIIRVSRELAAKRHIFHLVDNKKKRERIDQHQHKGICGEVNRDLGPKCAAIQLPAPILKPTP